MFGAPKGHPECGEAPRGASSVQVMLLRPDAKVYERMVREIRAPWAASLGPNFWICLWSVWEGHGGRALFVKKKVGSGNFPCRLRKTSDFGYGSRGLSGSVGIPFRFQRSKRPHQKRISSRFGTCKRFVHF